MDNDYNIEEGPDPVYDEQAVEATIAACGGLAKCGGEQPHFRSVINGVAVCWEDGPGQGLKCRTVNGKFLRGDKAMAVFEGTT
jgi:hypothetical protein